MEREADGIGITPAPTVGAPRKGGFDPLEATT